MTIELHKLKDWAFKPVEHTYDSRFTALYSLCVGFGHDPLDVAALRYVDAPSWLAPPSMAAVLAWPGQWMRHPDSGIEWVRVVHGEQRLRLHEPLPAQGTVVANIRVSHVVDKGAGKGAIVTTSRSIASVETGRVLATVEQVNFCRGDGGFLQPGEAGDEPMAPLPPTPDRVPDRYVDIPTRPETALLYSLCGDGNPLHADPVIAQAAGFPRPILHGLATYGTAGRALLKALVEDDGSRLTALDARFAAPVFPGETLRTEIWLEEGTARFRVKVLERDLVVLSHGRAGLG